MLTKVAKMMERKYTEKEFKIYLKGYARGYDDGLRDEKDKTGKRTSGRVIRKCICKA